MAFAFNPRTSTVRFCLASAALILAGSSALGADGFNLPAAPVGPGGEDSVTTSEGVRCSQSINSSGGYLDFGIVGGDLSASYDDDASGQSAVGYARVVIPIGATPKRLDCARLYDLEIARLKAEIDLLKIGLE